MGACGDCHVQVCAYSHMKAMMTDPGAVPAGKCVCVGGSNSSRQRLFEEKVGRGDMAESASVE